MPVGDVLVGDSGGDIEHDDTALALDVVAIAETTELLLAGGVPDVEADRAEVGREGDRVNLDTKRGCGTAVARFRLLILAKLAAESMTLLLTDVLLLEFTSKMALYD